jgi:hypothetical protein
MNTLLRGMYRKCQTCADTETYTGNTKLVPPLKEMEIFAVKLLDSSGITLGYFKILISRQPGRISRRRPRFLIGSVSIKTPKEKLLGLIPSVPLFISAFASIFPKRRGFMKFRSIKNRRTNGII